LGRIVLLLTDVTSDMRDSFGARRHAVVSIPAVRVSVIGQPKIVGWGGKFSLNLPPDLNPNGRDRLSDEA
jgi:hypothetical protein